MRNAAAVQKDPSGQRRLDVLFQMAQHSRRWTRRELAAAMGRDLSNLVTVSGRPKVDVVARLAQALGWPGGLVVELLGTHTPGKPECGMPSARGAAPDGLPRRRLERGATSGALRVAEPRRAERCPPVDGWRLATAIRLGRDGRYERCCELLRAALDQTGQCGPESPLLLLGLASAYLALGHAAEALALASPLTRTVPARPRAAELSRSRGDNQAPATVLAAAAEAVAALARRLQAGRALRGGREARRALAAAQKRCAGIQDGGELFELAGLPRRHADALLAAAARQMTVLEDPRAAVEEAERGASDLITLDAAHPSGRAPARDRKVVAAWTCLWGCAAALHSTSSGVPSGAQHADRHVQRRAADVLRAAAAPIERLEDWRLRELWCTLDWRRRRQLEAWTGQTSPWPDSPADLRLVAGLLGRFPGFAPIGRAIVERWCHEPG